MTLHICQRIRQGRQAAALKPADFFGKATFYLMDTWRPRDSLSILGVLPREYADAADEEPSQGRRHLTANCVIAFVEDTPSY